MYSKLSRQTRRPVRGSRPVANGCVMSMTPPRVRQPHEIEDRQDAVRVAHDVRGPVHRSRRHVPELSAGHPRLRMVRRRSIVRTTRAESESGAFDGRAPRGRTTIGPDSRMWYRLSTKRQIVWRQPIIRRCEERTRRLGERAAAGRQSWTFRCRTTSGCAANHACVRVAAGWSAITRRRSSTLSRRTAA